MGLGYFKKKKLQLEQKQTERLNKKRLQVKAQRLRAENKSRLQREIDSDRKKITKLSSSKKSKRLQKFGSRTIKNLQSRSKPNPLFSGTGGGANPIYSTSSGNNPYDFSGSSKKKKSNKKGGKTITIRL